VAKLKGDSIDPKSVIDDFFKYVEEYRRASAALDKVTGALWPTQQIRGLLIELALKTYLCAAGSVERGHDLEDLARQAMSEGLSLSQDDLQNIITCTNEIYCKITRLDHKYLCRYPVPNRGLLFTVTPGHRLVDEMVRRVVAQAREKMGQSGKSV